MLKQFVEIKTDFEATHNWPECNIEEVEFLKNEHRHKIYIDVAVMTSSDRQVEFFMLKMMVDDLIEKLYGTERIKSLGRKSMEEICSNIIEGIEKPLGYPVAMRVRASEDGQVSSLIEYERD